MVYRRCIAGGSSVGVQWVFDGFVVDLRGFPGSIQAVSLGNLRAVSG